MENQQQQGGSTSSNQNKAIQQENITQEENGTPGTSYAEDTQINKEKADELAEDQENDDDH